MRKINKVTTDNKRTTNTAITTAQIYNNLMEAELGLDDEIKIEIYDYIEINNEVESNMNYVINHLNSQGSKNLYLGINNQLTNASDYASIVTILDSNTILVNNSTFSNFDKQVLNIFIETSKSSAYYWYVENQDANRNSETSKTAAPNWVRKDGNGIAQASIGWALVAGLSSGPAAPATYFLSCAIGGALSSIWPD